MSEFVVHLPGPSELIRKLVQSALAEGVATADWVAAIKKEFSTGAEAWSQCILLDSHHAIRLWSSPMPFTVCLQLTDAVCKAFGGPPPVSELVKFLGISTAAFAKIVGGGSLGMLAVNPKTDHDVVERIITAVCVHRRTRDCPLTAHARTTAVGFVWRCLTVTTRRLNGARVELPYLSAMHVDGCRNTAIPLRTAQHLMSLSDFAADVQGLELLMATMAPSAWIDRPWSWYGINNFVLDAVALWVNVVARSPVVLKPWAVECCRELNRLAPAGNPSESPEFLREYDPETKRYYACWSGLNAPGGWIHATAAPSVLKAQFAQRRMAMRIRSVGRILSLLTSATGEFGSRFARETAETLHRFLQTNVPGDQGLLHAETLRAAADDLLDDGYMDHHVGFVAWYSVNKLPWAVLLAGSKPMLPVPPDVSTEVKQKALTLAIVRRAMLNADAGRAMIRLANISGPNDAVINPHTSAEVTLLRQQMNLNEPPGAVLHAALGAVCGAFPAKGRYSATVAVITALSAPDASIPHALLGTRRLRDPGTFDEETLEALRAAVGGLQRHGLPLELRLLVLRRLIVAEALAL